MRRFPVILSRLRSVATTLICSSLTSLSIPVGIYYHDDMIILVLKGINQFKPFKFTFKCLYEELPIAASSFIKSLMNFSFS